MSYAPSETQQTCLRCFTELFSSILIQFLVHSSQIQVRASLNSRAVCILAL